MENETIMGIKDPALKKEIDATFWESPNYEPTLTLFM